MSTDEFNEDVLFSLEDDFIEEVIPLVPVKEEILRDDAILRLNKDQINAAITNLVIDRYKNSTLLRNKVASYSKLFFNYPLDVNVVIKNLKPVILCDKLTYFATDDEHTQNKEYEYSHFLKSDKLANFLTQFHSINRDTSKQTSIQSANKLYALYAPFSTRDNPDIHSIQYQPLQDEDAVRHCIFDEYDCDSNKQETFRLLGQVKRNDIVYYDGDTVNVLGFFNHANVDDVSFEEFDINEYIVQVKRLKEGDKIHVVFNRPVFDSSFKKLRKSSTGTVKRVGNGELFISLNDTIHENAKISYDAISFSLSNILANNVFLYSAKIDIDDCFSKRKLWTTNILFRLPQDTRYNIEDIQTFILPNTVAELILTHEKHFHLYKNIHEIQYKLLQPFNINVNELSNDTYHLLSYIFSKHKLSKTRQVQAIQPRKTIPYRNTTPLLDFSQHQQLFDFYTKKYSSQDQYVDDALNRFRYLKGNRDNGAYYVLSVLGQTIKKKYKSHVQSLARYKKSLAKVEGDLDQLDFAADANTDNRTNLCSPKYSKEYKKLDKLVADNGKVLYFDKKLDITSYNILQGVTARSNNELKVHVMNELLNNSKYKHISRKDLEFEVEAIVSGKRRVRLGDMCVLHATYNDIVYVRKNVDGHEMWVKQFTTPFKICTDNPLVNFNDIVKLDTCVKQSFEDVCRTNKDARIMYKYQLLKSIQNTLKNILALLENYENIDKLLQNDITSYEYLNSHVHELYYPTRTFEHHEHIDYEEYDGEQGNVDSVDFTIDGNDLGNFVFVANQQGSEQSKPTELENQETLNMLLSFIQIPLDNNEFTYILQNINGLYPRSTIEQTLQQLEAVFWKKYNINILKPSKEQLQLLKDKLNQAKQKKEIELISKYYFNVLRTMIAYIIVIIFVRYPDYTIQVIIPSCVKLLSYVGYPISDKADAQRSLVNYFACLLTKISVSDDVRFALFYEKEPQEIHNAIKEAIDTILLHNIELKVQLDIMKPKIATYKQHINHEYVKENTEMQGFKPNFKFGNIERTNQKTKKVLSYLKVIQQTVANSKIAKQSVLNIPNLFNACCAEVLKRDTDFFDYFNTSNEYRVAKSKLHDLPSQGFHDINLHPNVKNKVVIDLFSKYNIQQKQDVVAILPMASKGDDILPDIRGKINQFISVNQDVTLVDVLADCVTNYNKTNWWEDRFYPMLHLKWDELTRLISVNIPDKTDSNIIEYIKSVIVDVGSVVEDLKTTRNVLSNFMGSKVRSILGSIINVKKLSKEVNDEMSLRNDPLYSIIVSVSNNKHYQHVLQELKSPVLMSQNIHQLYFHTDDEEDTVKNISLLAYIFVTTMLSILQRSHSTHEKIMHTEQNVVTQDNVKISCMIVYYILNRLAASFANTLVEPSKLKKAVEELRERRKQELIASYKVDDEERQLQITLKNMGLESWADILTGNDTEQNEPSVEATYNQKDEYDMAKDEIYQTFKGEHNDAYGEDEDDEDVMVSYEAYDY